MERRTILTANVIRAVKAYWLQNPGHTSEELAFRNMTQAIEDYFGGEDERNDGEKASTEHRLPRGDG
jgi:hypothetical protein